MDFRIDLDLFYNRPDPYQGVSKAEEILYLTSERFQRTNLSPKWISTISFHNTIGIVAILYFECHYNWGTNSNVNLRSS